MKKRLLLIPMTLFFLTGCTNAIDDEALLDNRQDENISLDSDKITQIEAIEISNEVLNKISTRTTSADIPAFEYVIADKSSQKSASNDTLAYVINYPEDKGFVILATDKRVNPLLAFSERGHFSFDNVTAKEMFVDKLGLYLERAKSNAPFDFGDIAFDNSSTVEPFIKISLDQRNPWDKYVIQEHPGCPVGCLAVATALVMTYSKEELYYHEETWQFKKIISAIENKNVVVPVRPTPPTKSQGINPLPPISMYTYDWGVERMAKLLYWIGVDLGMTYTTDGSSAPMINSYNLCRDLNYSIPSGYTNYNINEVARYLRTDHIICLYGVDLNGEGAHAWVSDGCMATVSVAHPEQPIVNYIHCDWGWGGSSNGYFKGDVFEVGYKFEVRKYFAVKREWK